MITDFNMESKFKLLTDYFGHDRFKFNELLKDHTVLRVGGPAKLFFTAFTIQEVIKIIKICRELKVRFFIFGTGSKMIISDYGFDGLIIKNSTRNISTVSVKGKVSKLGIGVEEATIEVDSGVSIDRFMKYLTSQGLSTSDFTDFSGSIGGNLLTNKLLQSKVKSIKVLDSDSEKVDLVADQLKNFHIILSAVFRVKAKI